MSNELTAFARSLGWPNAMFGGLADGDVFKLSPSSDTWRKENGRARRLDTRALIGVSDDTPVLKLGDIRALPPNGPEGEQTMTPREIERWAEGLHVGDRVAVHEAPDEPSGMFTTGDFQFIGRIRRESGGYWFVAHEEHIEKGFLLVGKGTGWNRGGQCIRPLPAENKEAQSG